MVDAICRDGARQLETPAPPPNVRTATDVAEAFLGRLDGSAFDAPTRLAGDVATRIERWGRSVTGERGRLIVRLDPPDDANVWHLAVFATGTRGEPLPIEQAIVNAGAGRPHLEDETHAPRTHAARVVAARAGRGGARSSSARTRPGTSWPPPARSSRRPDSTCVCPRCRGASPRRRCACSSTPRRSRSSVRTNSRTCGGRRCSTTSSSRRPTSPAWRARRGRSSARAAAGSRSTRPTCRPRPTRSPNAPTRRSSRARRRCASRSASRARRSRAASRSSAAVGRPICSRPRPTSSSAPAGTPTGFVGELRSYQAEALAWLGFLGQAGLGGCLALDMGLGKTPTMLADLLAGAGSGPALVIAPPAVVGNWTAEAARFTPGLRVVVHHGANRAAADEIAAEVADADVVVTTYGTAVRDIDAICRGVVVEGDPRRGAGDQEPGERHVATVAPHQRAHAHRAHRHADRERSRRPVGDPRLREPRVWSARARSSSRGSRATAAPARVEAEDAMRALNGILVFRRTKAEPAIADGAARPDRRARPLRDDARADRSVPGAARHAGDGRGAARRRQGAQRPDPRRDHRAQADLQPPRRVPGRRPSARGSVGQARPARGDRRRGVRGRRERAGVHPLRAVGHQARRPPHEAHGHAGRRVTTAGSRAPPAIRSSPTSRAATVRACSCCR